MEALNGGETVSETALEVLRACALGVPKYVVSTVSFSPLIPADRLSPDIQMILWAGGLYGLNSVCKSSLSQAAGPDAGERNRSGCLLARRGAVRRTDQGR